MTFSGDAYKRLDEMNGDCLADQVNAAGSGFASPETIANLSERLTDKQGNLGRLTCEASGCTAQCTIEIADGAVVLDIAELGRASNDCRKLQDVMQEFSDLF